MFSDIFGPIKTAFSILLGYWWVFMPILLFFGAIETWLMYKREEYLRSLQWVLLEIKSPPEITKSPKMAENIFSALHASYITSTTWKRKFFKGAVQNWISLEIIGTGGEIRFYIRVSKDSRNFVESQIFAQYPEAEIKEAEDYIYDLPEHLPNNEYDLFGTELVFTKPDAYPIKTHPFFEEESGKDEMKRTDPLAPLLETMSTLEPGEHIWLQFLIRGTNDAWAKDAQKVVDKILGKKEEKKKDAFSQILAAIFNAFSGEPAKEEKKERDDMVLQRLTPGQRFVLEQVENKISKLGFKSGCRFIYIGRKEAFHRSHISAVIGTFKQVYSNNLNSFKPNGETITVSQGLFHWIFPSDSGFFAKSWEYNRKVRIYQNFRKRFFMQRWMILDTEELATLFHLPSSGVKAPSLPIVEAKRGQPPIGLPIDFPEREE
jgi:hypothetical protein